MKVLCDVCGKEGASVLCCADEAALCDACDRRVHRANKLAGKHRRFSLSAQSHPACDICQEKRGFLFCQEDRAILCRDCDASVHSANHLTMKHNRFILTGVHLSAAPISSSPSPESVAEAKTSTKSAVPMSNQNKASVADGSTPIASTSTTTGSSATAAGTVTSSISEYLTKTCPGWRVEDLLVDDAAFGVEDFAKGDELLPFLEADLDSGGLDALAERFPVWAPHVPQYPPPPGLSSAADGSQSSQGSKEAGLERWSEDVFTVPQISPASTPSKRPRHSFWYY
ncbi:hypothetical protein OPV22_034487 [Ensete ventricosum]|uniref:B box-type domain-containing protein n=1 Tax=Ensete ventricosum TaxID=4639 RepID=A0AAV8P1W8_ENSVE|nr:hypothetical protein OPV22_034487 [Ensete ventricosum]